MKIQRFEEIVAWQRGQDLAIEIYSIFNSVRDFGFKDQICRAAVSVSNNIAEGFDRKSRADFSRFLYIALSSCSEVKSMLYLAHRLNYINDQEREQLMEKSAETSRIINGLIKSLNPLTTDH
jgi:four helix bundle protein